MGFGRGRDDGKELLSVVLVLLDKQSVSLQIWCSGRMTVGVEKGVSWFLIGT